MLVASASETAMTSHRTVTTEAANATATVST
jgi:hypothetical protein